MMKNIYCLTAIFAALLGVGCTPANPLNTTVSGPGPDLTMLGIIEVQDQFLFYSPTTSGVIATQAPAFGGPVSFSFGGASMATMTWGTPGVGGPSGNFSSDYFIRWQGFKGPDASLDYSSISFFFKGTTTNFDLSPYKGITFFARGHGNFAVALSGPGTATGQTGPYKGYNYFTKLFGSNLAGDDEWKQITINFSSLTQLYGEAANINDVLKKAWGIQINQEVPLVSNFTLDLDYIRLIPADSVVGY